MMTVVPSLEQAHENLLNQMIAFHGIVSEQPRLSSTKAQPALLRTAVSIKTYKSILSIMPHGQVVLMEAHSVINNVMEKVKKYVDEWIGYQALWWVLVILNRRAVMDIFLKLKERENLQK